jgi:hypothetical protein
VLIIKHGRRTTKEFLNMANEVGLRENKTLFIQCDCRSEILTIEYDYVLDITELAMYEHHMSFKHKMSLWQRLRYCWQVLWHKKPYADQMVLDRKQLQKLLNFLQDISLDQGV